MTILNKYSDDATTQVRNASHGQILLRRRGREGNCSLNILRCKAGKVCKNLVYAVSASKAGKHSAQRDASAFENSLSAADLAVADDSIL